MEGAEWMSSALVSDLRPSIIPTPHQVWGIACMHSSAEEQWKSEAIKSELIKLNPVFPIT